MRTFQELSEHEKLDLIQRYYNNNENVKKLIAEYDLHCDSSKLYLQFPPEELKEKCPYCDIPLVRKRTSKSMGYNCNPAFCISCGHRVKEGYKCCCSKCLEVVRKSEEAKIEAIRETYGIYHEKLECNKLDFTDNVYVGSLMRLFPNVNDESCISPYVNSPVKLTPYDLSTRNIYNSLIDKGIISVSPNSTIEGFLCDSPEFPNRYYIYRVFYDINLINSEERQCLTSYYMKAPFFNIESIEYALELWMCIATEECVEFLNYELSRVGMPENATDKTKTIFRIMLDDFSVSEIYFMIWRSIERASSKFLEFDWMTKEKASVYAVNEVCRYAEQVAINNWHVKPFSRNYNLPQSELSTYFFNVVTRLGDRGFKEAPNRKSLEDILLKSDCIDYDEDELSLEKSDDNIADDLH